MKILVTGVAGFIGSALASALQKAGHTVVGVDNFNDYYDVKLKRDRAVTFLSDIKLIEGDLGDDEVLSNLFKEHKFDVVCHLAGSAGVRYSLAVPEWYIENNVGVTTRLYETMRKHDVKRMVFASTSSVYGNNTKTPFVESAAADRPISVYAATKRSCELIGHTYFDLYGIETTALRFFTVYGPWSRPDMAMFKFAKQMLAGEPIDVYNQGDLKRDFTHVDDIVRGFRLAIDKPLGYEVVNLGRGEAVSLGTYIDCLESALGLVAKRNLLPMQPGDVYETFADTTKAKQLLDFSASVSVTDGVKSFADWYLSRYAPK